VQAIRDYLQAVAKTKGWYVGVVSIFVETVERRIESIAERLGWPDSVADWAGYWWSSSDLLEGRRFSYWINKGFRGSGLKTACAFWPLCIFARALERPPPLRDDFWPRRGLGDRDRAPVRSCFRGCAIPESEWDFFKAGLFYRVPFPVSTSIEASVAVAFASQPMATPVLMEVLLAGHADHDGDIAACYAGRFLERQLEGELELLFAANTVFEVLEARVMLGDGLLGRHLALKLYAVATGGCVGPEALPVATWH